MKSLIKYSIAVVALVNISNVQALDINVTGGSWLMSWEQKDSVSLAAIANPINNVIKIDDSASTWFGLSTNVETGFPIIESIPLSYQYQSLQGSNPDTDTSASAVSFAGFVGLDMTWIMPSYRFEGATTSGTANAYDPSTLNKANISFETEMSVKEYFVRFPKLPGILSNIELGMRTTKKTAPQSIYIMLNKNTLSSVSNAKMIDSGGKWSADYFLIGLNNTYNLKNKEKKLNFKYKIITGVGTADLTSSLLSGFESYLNQGAATLSEIDVSLNYRLLVSGLDIDMTAGYKMLEEKVALGQTDSLHIYAASESSYSGPYFLANIHF